MLDAVLGSIGGALLMTLANTSGSTVTLPFH